MKLANYTLYSQLQKHITVCVCKDRQAILPLFTGFDLSKEAAEQLKNMLDIDYKNIIDRGWTYNTHIDIVQLKSGPDGNFMIGFLHNTSPTWFTSWVWSSGLPTLAIVLKKTLKSLKMVPNQKQIIIEGCLDEFNKLIEKQRKCNDKICEQSLIVKQVREHLFGQIESKSLEEIFIIACIIYRMLEYIEQNYNLKDVFLNNKL